MSAERKKIPFFIKEISRFNALPLQARLGLLFPFLPFLLPVSHTFPCGEEGGFSLIRVFRSPSICSQLAHTSPTRLVTRFADVVPLPGPQNRTQGHTGPNSFFLPRTSLPSPFRGRGGILLIFGVSGFPGSCLWQLPLTTGSHGPNRAGLGLRQCRSPTLPSNRPYIATQGRIWFHRLFFLAFLGGSPASCRSRW